MASVGCPLKLVPYVTQKGAWPASGKHILAQFDDQSIIVYQAYNSKIARALVSAQNFHSTECSQSGYSMTRMTWIKTNFLWMMFRSGWATKPGQERILAIRLKRAGFEEILHKSVRAARSESECSNQPSKNDEVRLQWDPDHFPNGNKVEGRRAIQLGIRGSMLERMSKEFIVRIDDITDIVETNRNLIDRPNELMVPAEEVYPIDDESLAKWIGLS